MLFCTSTAHAAIWYVHPDSALNTIQIGLNSCDNDDTVLVGPGVYYENIIWPNTQGINLVSEYGTDTTIIDGDSAGTVITIIAGVDSTTIIDGFTIQHGSSGQYGGGIQCSASAPAIMNNIIRENFGGGTVWTPGGGIGCLSASPIITSNLITDNTAYYGGAIGCCDATPLVTNNTINNNTSYSGGGIFFIHDSPNISNNTVSGNIASEFGGGIYCHNALPIITNNTITENAANYGGGISCFYECARTSTDKTVSEGDKGTVYGQKSPYNITRNTITANIAFYYGGGISCILASLSITNNIITGNSADSGGGIACILGSSTINRCTISNNNGDGVYCSALASPVISYNDIINNMGYGIRNVDSMVVISAEYNWWGDSTGPYHPDFNPGGLGDTVSDYVDFDPWLYNPWGIEEGPVVKPVEHQNTIGATIFRGPLHLPESKKCKVFDITGRVVEPDKIRPGIYFIEVDGVVTQKVVKVR